MIFSFVVSREIATPLLDFADSSPPQSSRFFPFFSSHFPLPSVKHFFFAPFKVVPPFFRPFVIDALSPSSFYCILWWVFVDCCVFLCGWFFCWHVSFFYFSFPLGFPSRSELDAKFLLFCRCAKELKELPDVPDITPILFSTSFPLRRTPYSRALRPCASLHMLSFGGFIDVPLLLHSCLFFSLTITARCS